nr:MAG: hypothetical protein 2 [Solemoviridae sp.]
MLIVFIILLLRSLPCVSDCFHGRVRLYPLSSPSQKLVAVKSENGHLLGYRRVLSQVPNSSLESGLNVNSLFGVKVRTVCTPPSHAHGVMTSILSHRYIVCLRAVISLFLTKQAIFVSWNILSSIVSTSWQLLKFINTSLTSMVYNPRESLLKSILWFVLLVAMSKWQLLLGFLGPRILSLPSDTPEVHVQVSPVLLTCCATVMLWLCIFAVVTLAIYACRQRILNISLTSWRKASALYQRSARLITLKSPKETLNNLLRIWRRRRERIRRREHAEMTGTLRTSMIPPTLESDDLDLTRMSTKLKLMAVFTLLITMPWVIFAAPSNNAMDILHMTPFEELSMVMLMCLMAVILKNALEKLDLRNRLKNLILRMRLRFRLF